MKDLTALGESIYLIQDENGHITGWESVGNMYLHYCDAWNFWDDVPLSGYFLRPGETCPHCGKVMSNE